MEEICGLHVCVCCQAVHCYTQALSEAGVHAQRAACVALSCLQVSMSSTLFQLQSCDYVMSYRVNKSVEICVIVSLSQAVESIREVVALCDSADEELRRIAIQTLLTFGMSAASSGFSR